LKPQEVRSLRGIFKAISGKKVDNPSIWLFPRLFDINIGITVTKRIQAKYKISRRLVLICGAVQKDPMNTKTTPPGQHVALQVAKRPLTMATSARETTLRGLLRKYVRKTVP